MRFGDGFRVQYVGESESRLSNIVINSKERLLSAKVQVQFAVGRKQPRKEGTNGLPIVCLSSLRVEEGNGPGPSSSLPPFHA